ncbi:PKHD1L1 [Symbiodinium sp. CCMP2592]|nr:PKHD1L1 [Symbiodinium sp. CCMP2592]
MAFLPCLWLLADLVTLRVGAASPNRWSSMPNRCTAGSNCVVPADEHWLLDWSPPELASLTIRGKLEWDSGIDDLQLTAGYVLVEGKGILEIGTESQPMSNLATINLTDAQASPHPTLGSRFLAGQDKAQIHMHGRPLGTWTLLARDVAKGESEIELKEDPRALSWRIGDVIGIATTNRGRTQPYKIVELGLAGSKTVKIDPPAAADYWGGWRPIHHASGRSSADFNKSFELAAEVVNLQRSVVITGPPNWDTADWKGLHTLMTGHGFMDARYIRVENCGQPPHQGRYCLHFHLMHRCPRCVLHGNAVVNSTQVGITVHGTHQARVSSNILWNTMSAGVYVEDGNEMNNTFEENILICMHQVPPINPLPCNKGDTGICPEARRGCTYDMFNQGGRLGGFFVIGMTNDFIRNRVVNMENCFWFKGTADPAGRGHAAGKVCPVHLPLGRIRGNVCHDNRRFGMYLDSQQPRMLPRDENGFVADIHDPTSSCFNEVTPTGQDAGVVPANVVEDELDWHNEFVGQYILTDVRYVRYVGINNMHCMYWKSSKKFADEGRYHVADSMCINVPSGGLFSWPAGQFLGPAGAFTFGLKNVTFVGNPGASGALSAGQHCMDGGAGGPCNVQYLLEDVDFSAVSKSTKLIQFGVNSKPEGKVLPVFLARDGSLGGFRSIVSSHLDGFLDQGCEKLGLDWDSGFGCNFPVRRLSVWTPAAVAGDVQLSGPGFTGVAPNYQFPSFGGNAGLLSYAMNYNGYGALAIPGRVYELTGEWRDGPMVDVDFSDGALPGYFGDADEEVTLKTSLGTCTLRSSKAHPPFTGRLGPVPGAPQSDCGTKLFNPTPAQPSGEAVVEGVNIALNRPTVASSTEGGNPNLSSNRAVDGSSETRWGSAFSDGEWLAIDLGVVYELFAVSIDWEAAYASTYSVQLRSNEAEPWHTAAEAVNGHEGQVQTIFPEHNARYVRIVCQTRATPWGCSIKELQVFPTYLGLFEPVDGGTDRACRGESSSDNSPAHYTVVQKDSLKLCKKACEETPNCVGVEYSSARCELWTRRDRIGASIALTGFTCLHFLRPSSECQALFEGVDGSEGRACRGNGPGDNSFTYYYVRNAESIDSCQAFCEGDANCVGMEYSASRCEVWIRPEGIQASIQLPGFSCRRIVRWGTGCSSLPGPAADPGHEPVTSTFIAAVSTPTAWIVCALVVSVALLAVLALCWWKKRAWPSDARTPTTPKSDVEKQHFLI